MKEKPFNLKVIEVRESISKIINESRLPITVVTEILSNIYNSAIEAEKQIVNNEKIEYEQTESEQTSE